MDILNLPGFKILDIEENQHGYRIFVESTSKPSFCPHCGCKNKVAPHGTKSQLVRDVNIHGKRVGLLYRRKRYKCKECGATFLELNDNIESKRRFTKRLISYVEQQALRKPFLQIADELGISHTSVSTIFKDYVHTQEAKYNIETPRVLGIDEIVISRPKGVIFNIEENTIVELLPNRNKETVIEFLQTLDKPSNIEVAVIDMWKPYKDAVKAILKDADIVVDKFHVIKMANHILNNIRISIKDTLTGPQRRQLKRDKYMFLKNSNDLTLQEKLIMESWLGMFPALQKSYEFKEELVKIFDSQDVYEAEQRLLEWKRKIDNDTAPFLEVLKAFENWRTEIMNYFKHRVTNAYTESLNNIIRLIDRLGRGYSFEVLRAKVLFGVRHRTRHVMTKYGTEQIKPVLYHSMSDYGYVAENNISGTTVDYGVDISTLIKLLEQDDL